MSLFDFSLFETSLENVHVKLFLKVYPPIYVIYPITFKNFETPIEVIVQSSTKIENVEIKLIVNDVVTDRKVIDVDEFTKIRFNLVLSEGGWYYVKAVLTLYGRELTTPVQPLLVIPLSFQELTLVLLGITLCTSLATLATSEKVQTLLQVLGIIKQT